MKKRIKESKEYKEMIDAIHQYCNSEYPLLYNVQSMCNSQKYTYECYKLLLHNIDYYYGAMPLYKNNLIWYATQLYDFIRYDDFKVYQAKKVVKEYDECKMDLETLHNRLIQIFGNIKDAFEWFNRYDKMARAI